MPPKKPEPVAAEPVVEAPVDPTASDEQVRVWRARFRQPLLLRGNSVFVRAVCRLRVEQPKEGRLAWTHIRNSAIKDFLALQQPSGAFRRALYAIHTPRHTPRHLSSAPQP
jgi:hypothetical protein